MILGPACCVLTLGASTDAFIATCVTRMLLCEDFEKRGINVGRKSYPADTGADAVGAHDQSHQLSWSPKSSLARVSKTEFDAARRTRSMEEIAGAGAEPDGVLCMRPRGVEINEVICEGSRDCEGWKEKRSRRVFAARRIIGGIRPPTTPVLSPYNLKCDERESPTVKDLTWGGRVRGERGLIPTIANRLQCRKGGYAACEDYRGRSQHGFQVGEFLDGVEGMRRRCGPFRDSQKPRGTQYEVGDPKGTP
ncbi:hypothetical protein FB451DRAFT_1184942 [Mycena latifolia]|nr:hypothetical protein FB451DRAFT_1184942 [Mycena latifolia]